MVYEVVLERGAAADESSGARQGLPAGVDYRHNIIRFAETSRDAPAAGSVDRGGVRFIQDDACAITVGERENFAQRRNIAVHAEHGFRDDQFATAFRVVLTQRGFEYGEIKVRVDAFAHAGKADTVDQAGMI